jgi:hypothetical protein
MKNKLSALFIILIIGLLVFLQSCKLNRIPETGEIIYDIRGEWTINFFYSMKSHCTFTGTMSEGIVTPVGGDPGTYKVGGETGVQVEFFFYTNKDDKSSYMYCVGRFHDDNYMEGAGSISWGAVRESD